MKQWIITCDKVYTGNSSVIVEAFFAKKMCQLLFPLPTTEGFELQLITDSKKISTYDGFYQSVTAKEEAFPTPEESIEDIYLIDWKTPNYVKFADMAEEVIKDDYYQLSRRQLKAYKEYGIAQRLVRGFVKMKPLYKVYLSLLENPKWKWSFIEHQRRVREKTHKSFQEFEEQHAHELTSEEEIHRIIKRIRYALEEIKS